MNINTNSKPFIIGFILSILLTTMLFSIPVFAIENSSVNNGVTYIDESNIDNSTNTVDAQIPNVSVSEVSDLVEKKTYEVVTIMQVFSKPFASIIFIFCAIMSLIGAITKGGYLAKGLIGMFISGMIYTAIMYAPDIVRFFSTWLIM